MEEVERAGGGGSEVESLLNLRHPRHTHLMVNQILLCEKIKSERRKSGTPFTIHIDWRICQPIIMVCITECVVCVCVCVCADSVCVCVLECVSGSYDC